MLSNAYFLAKIRFDTVENEPAKNLQKTIANFATPILKEPSIDLVRVEVVPDGGRRGGPRGRELGPAPEARGPRVRRASLSQVR